MPACRTSQILLSVLVVVVAFVWASDGYCQGTGWDNSFVNYPIKPLPKFSPGSSPSRGVASVYYESSPHSKFDVAAQSRGIGQVENLRGQGLHLIEANGMQNVPPLHGEPGAFNNININNVIGANRFYSAGINGTGIVAANIEGGRAWNQHEALTHAVNIPTTLQPSVLDRHATWTSMVLGGRPGGTAQGLHQVGVAPGAELHTGGMATGWAGTRYSFAFSFFTNVLFEQYNNAMFVGLNGPGGVQTADVVNSSYAVVGEPVASIVELMLDAMAATSGTTVMSYAAGNSGLGLNTVNSPASGYNGITVASLSAASGYEMPSITSSGGDINYSDPVNGIAIGARRGVDIAVPGENLGSAYYGGLTGGNGTTLMGPPSGPLGGPDFYTRDLDGTSYASPQVAGGAGLLHNAAQVFLPATTSARDIRVIKSVLLNSAHKTTGWNNGQVAHPNGNGGVMTTVSLDARVGTGRMDLDAAFDQFLGGTTDVAGTALGDQGKVQEIGWDFGLVAEGTPTDYFVTRPLEGGTTFTATLTWLRDRRVEQNGGAFNFIDDNFSDLDLQVWSVANGAPDMLISESSSTFNNTEHLSFLLPETGRYMIRVEWFQEIFDAGVGPDPNEVLFGLAWSGTAIPIPEPSTLVLLTVCVVLGCVHRRRRQRGRLQMH